MADYFNPVGIPSMSPMDYAYFAQAMQTPVGAYQMQYPWNVSFKGGSNTSFAGTTASTPATSNASAPVSEKKSNAGLVLGGILTVGATALCIAGHRRGPATEQGLKRTWEGIKTIFGKGAQQEQATMRMLNKKKVVTLPGRRNVMPKGEGLENIGLEAPKADTIITKTNRLTSGCEVESFTRTNFNQNSKKYTIKWNKDGSYTVIAGNNHEVTNMNEDLKKAIEKEIERIQKGAVTLNDFSKIKIVHTNKENGLISEFAKAKGGNLELTNCSSQYFPLDDIAVARTCEENSAFKKVIDNFRNDKIKELTIYSKDIYLSNLNTGKYTVQSCKIDKSGNIIELTATQNGKKVTLKSDSEEFKDITLGKKEELAKLIKNEQNVKNTIYLAA